MYIIGSLTNIKAVNSLGLFLKNTGKFAVNDAWISHGRKPDIHYFNYAKSHSMDKSSALTTATMKSIFALDAGFIEDADIIINLQPSGNSSSVEGGMAFRAGKFTVLIISDEDERNYKKVEVMFNCYTMIISYTNFVTSGWKKLFKEYHTGYHVDYFNHVFNSFNVKSSYY